MTASKDDKFSRTFSSTNPNVARVQTERSALGTNLICDNLAGWPTDTGVRFSTYTVGTDGKTVSRQTDWAGVVSGNTITSLTREAGASDTGNQINEYVEMLPTAKWADELVTGILVQHKQDGTHTGITTDTLTTSGNVTIGGTLTIAGASSDGGWTPISGSISAVTYNGNRSYTLTTSSDNTANVSSGMRLRTTRTVSAPTQSASLNGTTQYFSKSSPAGMTFTDDFVVSAWIKLSSYTTLGSMVATRFNGTNGWYLWVNASGQVELTGCNSSAGNYSGVKSYQAVPLDRWVHITAQLDMSSFTNSPTTSYIMIDGIDVPAAVFRAGTNPTALVQAGDLNIGYWNTTGSYYFSGKIAQVAIYSAKVTQANVLATISQGLVGNETSLISAYSLSNSVNDLNANANNLTANGSAVATNADSPFGCQADGTISSTLDYGIVQSATSSTLVVQVPEGCTIPTTGGVASASYSNVKAPYGFPNEIEKFGIQIIYKTNRLQGSPSVNVWYNILSSGIDVPTGKWRLTYNTPLYCAGSSGTLVPVTTLSTSTSADVFPSVTGGLYTSSTVISSMISKYLDVAAATQTRYYQIFRFVAGSVTSLGSVDGDYAGIITAENAYL